MNHAGLGFRRGFADDLLENTPAVKPAFLELAPENWIGMGGYWKKQLDKAASQYPLHAHGLSLSLGSTEPLDIDFLRQVKSFLDEYQIGVYSEHLSFSKTPDAHLYDLLPVPFTRVAADRMADRIAFVQDSLGRRIAVENVSYYTAVEAEMDEADFIRHILEKADCDLLLDVNNVYVNAFNHGYDAHRFLSRLPLHRLAYIHIAGHEQVAPDLIIDTHGEPVISPVYDLLSYVVPQVAPVPVLLERDYNLPDLAELFQELQTIESRCARVWQPELHAA